MAKLFINNVEFSFDFDTESEDIIEELVESTVEILCEKLFLRKKYLSGHKNLGPYKKIKKDINETCPICLDFFKEGLYKRTLNCSHTFHKKCIDRWISKEHSCPICRKNPFVK